MELENKEGNLELVFGTTQMGLIRLYKDDSGWHNETIDSEIMNMRSVFTMDYDNDGRDEIFAASNSDFKVYVYSNDGAWNKELIFEMPFGTSVWSMDGGELTYPWQF